MTSSFPIVILHPKNVNKIAGLNLPPFVWIYADNNHVVYNKVKEVLNISGKRCVSPEEFQACVVQVRKDFTLWVDQNLSGAPDEEWLLTPLTRDPFNNDLFLHLAWLKAIENFLKEKSCPLVVVTDSLGLMQTLKKYCEKQFVKCCVFDYKMFFYSNVKSNLKSALSLGYRAFEVLIRMFFTRLILGAPYKKKLMKADILVDTFLHDYCLAENGQFMDRYFPGLIHYYEEHHFKPASFPYVYQIPATRLFSLYRRMKRSDILFVPFELFITLYDAFSALRVCMQNILKNERHVLPFLSIDVTSLVKNLNFSAALKGWTPLLLSLTPKQLFKHGVRPKYFMDWLENQTIDKAIMIGFRKAGGECKVIGIKQNSLINNWLSRFVTTEEVRAKVVPDEIWVGAQSLLESASVYDAMGKYRVVPALRYRQTARRENQKKGDEEKQKDILVLLPFSMDDALEVLNCVMVAVPDISCYYKTIHVKNHPDMDMQSVRSHVEKKWPEAKEKLLWTGADMTLDRLFSAAKIVVTMASSSAVEAVSCGIPVIIIGMPTGVELNPLEGVDERMWEIVYDADELKERILKWTPCHPLRHDERVFIGRKVSAYHFEPVTCETMQSFIPKNHC